MSNISKFLINESFLQVSCALMIEIGQSRAIVLQKLHSLILKQKDFPVMFEGRESYFASYQQWHELIPYISYDQIKRILVWLKDKSYIFSKKEGRKIGLWYSINYVKLLSVGFEQIEDAIKPYDFKNKKMSFILPTLVSLVGITSAVLLQDFYYNNGDKSTCMTHENIKKEWLHFVGIRQIIRLLHDLTNKCFFKFELSGYNNERCGNYYQVNKHKIDELVASFKAKDLCGEKSLISTGDVDNSLIVDNFHDQSRMMSPQKSHDVTSKVASCHPNTIDQDQERSFKKTILIPRGADQECGIIPEAKDDIVCLTERLMTHGFAAYSASQLINEFGLELLNRVIMLAANKEMASGELMGPGWITATAKNLKKGKHMNLQTIKSDESIYRKREEESAQKVYESKKRMMESRASNESGEDWLKKCRRALGRQIS